MSSSSRAVQARISCSPVCQPGVVVVRTVDFGLFLLCRVRLVCWSTGGLAGGGFVGTARRYAHFSQSLCVRQGSARVHDGLRNHSDSRFRGHRWCAQSVDQGL